MARFTHLRIPEPGGHFGFAEMAPGLAAYKREVPRGGFPLEGIETSVAYPRVSE